VEEVKELSESKETGIRMTKWIDRLRGAEEV
jgi:hypothetical protein